MTDQAQVKDPASVEAVRERAELGKEILGNRIASGEPGEKQKAHDDQRLSASKTVEALDDIAKQFEAETTKSSDERAKSGGNAHPIPAHERRPGPGPAVLAAAATAAGALGQARDAITQQLEGDARLMSDPRYERDQKVFEMGKAGKLGFVAPSEQEKDLVAAGRKDDIITLTPEEQVADDMKRLEDAEHRDPAAAANVARTEIEAGKQDMAEKNNGFTAQKEGKTGDEAVAKAKEAQLAEASSPPPTKGASTGKGPSIK